MKESTETMPLIRYQSFRFSDATRAVIAQANLILNEYAARGLVVTLRQLYYQFVSRDLIPNKQSEYKKLGSIINDARLAGLIDWDHLQDRTRNLQSNSHWDNPGSIIYSAARSYHRNLWEGQEAYVECWVEKDALIGILENICTRWDVPYFSCRGYTSQSEMWGAAQRLLGQLRCHPRVHIIHLGDHDPSGKDMSRDILDRLVLFLESKASNLTVNRIALNMDQVEEYNPPPNPAKLNDTRATAYIEEFGDESWELDALPPDVMATLIEDEIKANLDQEVFDEKTQQQEDERKVLTNISQRYDEVVDYLGEGE